MRGHSSYTSWYFVERAEISNVNVNVTISLSSSILNTHAPGSVSLPENRGGLFSRVIGASGFQLINVNNVPLQLSGWSTDTKLIGRRALQGSLTRHYIGQSIKEAHKVCQLSSCPHCLLLHLCGCYQGAEPYSASWSAAAAVAYSPCQKCLSVKPHMQLSLICVCCMRPLSQKALVLHETVSFPLHAKAEAYPKLFFTQLFDGISVFFVCLPG